MRLRIIQRTPLGRVGFLKKYAEYLDQAGFKIDALIWIIVSVVIGAGVGFAVLTLLPQFWQLGIVLAIVLLDVFIGMPYFGALKRIDAIEADLPDVLKQMGDTLKAGGTYEYALREVAEAEYGPLKKEMNGVLRKLEEGENFENSMSLLSERIDSRLVKRSVTIIIDSIRAGAGLADILDQISDDVRSMHRINRERVSRTLMQVMFMVLAGAVVAPAIFGFTSTVIAVLLSAAGATATPAALATAERGMAMITMGIQAYIFIMALAASAMISLMREGKFGKSIIYFPILLFIAYTAYTVAQIASRVMVGGAIG